MAIVMLPEEAVMGIKDWFKKKPEPVEQVEEPDIELPELDRDALFEETRNLLDAEEVKLVMEEIVVTTPEYDSGDVDVSALLDDDMESNYNLDTVEDFEVEDMLSGAEIVGDLPEEVDLE